MSLKLKKLAMKTNMKITKILLISGMAFLLVSCAQMAYNKAVNLENKGEFELALAEYQNLLQKYPTSEYASIARPRIIALNEIIRCRSLQYSAKDAEEHQDLDRAVNEYREALVLAMKYKLPETDLVREKLMNAQDKFALKLTDEADSFYLLKKYESAIHLYEKASKLALGKTRDSILEKMENAVNAFDKEKQAERQAERIEDVAKWKTKLATPLPEPEPEPTIEVIKSRSHRTAAESPFKEPKPEPTIEGTKGEQKGQEGPEPGSEEYYQKLLENAKKGKK